MELHWDLNISRIKPYKALAMKITKEKFLRNQNLKTYEDNFNSSSRKFWKNNIYDTQTGMSMHIVLIERNKMHF